MVGDHHSGRDDEAGRESVERFAVIADLDDAPDGDACLAGDVVRWEFVEIERRSDAPLLEIRAGDAGACVCELLCGLAFQVLAAPLPARRRRGGRLRADAARFRRADPSGAASVHRRREDGRHDASGPRLRVSCCSMFGWPISVKRCPAPNRTPAIGHRPSNYSSPPATARPVVSCTAR